MGIARGLYRLDPRKLGQGKELCHGNVAALSPDGQVLYAFEGGEVKVFDLGDNGPRPRPAILPAYKDRILTLALSGDGKVLAIGTGRQVHLWDALKLAPLEKTILTTVDTHQLSISARGDLVAVYGASDYAVYSLPGGKELGREWVPGIRQILLAPDGRLLIVQSARLTIRQAPWAKKAGK
jgi:hypothetical protein